MGGTENVPTSFKLITKTNRGYPKKCFRHIIERGSRLKMCRKYFQKLRTSKFSQFQSVLIKKECILKETFPKNFSPSWPYDVVLTSKAELCEQFEQFLQISAFYSIITWKLPHNTRVKIVYDMI